MELIKPVQSETRYYKCEAKFDSAYSKWANSKKFTLRLTMLDNN